MNEESVTSIYASQLTRAVLHQLPSESDQGLKRAQTYVDPHVFDATI